MLAVDRGERAIWGPRWWGYCDGFGDAGDRVRYGFVQGSCRLRWLVPGRAPEWEPPSLSSSG